MWKFVEKLAGAVGRAAKRAWNWLMGTPPVRFISHCYATAVVHTARYVLGAFYGGPRRARLFDNFVGRLLVRVLWEIILIPTTVGIAAYRLVKPPAVALARGVLMVTGFTWAALSLLWTLELSAWVWLCNTIGNATFRGAQWCYHKIAGTPAMPRRYTRYMTFREVFAWYMAALVPIHAGVLRLSRRALGDKPTWWLVQKETDLVARLHAPTYDWWFDDELPFQTPQDGGALTGVYITDVPEHETRTREGEISEKEKVENFFLSSGYVLVATDAPDKSDKDVFNEYMRERWANLNAAEIATDEFGRTWVVPFKTQPLFKDVAMSSEEERSYADREMDWQIIEDKVRRSHSFGRHWAAALVDQDDSLLRDNHTFQMERARAYSKLKGRQDLHVEHVLKGFDEWVGEHVTVTAEV